MPSKGTPRHAIRIDDDLWAQVKAKAKQEGINVSELIRNLLRGWVNKNEGEK